MTNQDLARYLGLPTYPINDSMRVGHRTPQELQYLANHGFFKSWSQHHIIIKQYGRYQLLRDYGPIPELEAEAPTLDALIKLHDIPIAAYQWHVNWLEDNEPAYPLPTYEDKVDTAEIEALEKLQELEPA
jgi:sugar phosphate isomerase/epimerase